MTELVFGLKLMLLGLSGVFVVLTMFYFLIKILMLIFTNKNPQDH